MALTSPIKNGDWASVRQAISRLASSKLGPTSTPTFLGVTTTSLTITGLTDDSLIYPVSGLLTSLGVASDGQIPIGSTGTTPILAGLTGTANRVSVTNGAGSITLATPQDIHTAASNFTVAGETITDLTASRLMYSDGSKVLSSVSDLTAWVAGTADHISVTDDGDGTVTLDLDTNTQTLLDSFNGIFLETIDFTIAEAGGTVTGSLEQDGGGDLIQRFSDGYTTLDTTPALTIDLTAYVGTNAVPKKVFVYILQSAKTVMAASNTDWPATEHIKIANLLLKSAVTTGTDGGALVNRNWNDHAKSADGQGHITHIEERLRQELTQWDNGVALTLKNSAGAELTTGNSSTAVELVTTVGEAYQLHKQTFPAVDMYTTATDDAHITNQPTDEGGAYETTVDLVTDITHYVDGTAAGVAIGTNKYFNLVVWGVQNRTGTPSHLMINLPTGQYNTSGNAVADVDGFSVYEIPSAFKGKGFLIARLTFRLIGGGQWTYIAQEDLRGKVPDVVAGVGITTTDHALLANLTAPADDHTQYLLADGTRAMSGNLDMGNQNIINPGTGHDAFTDFVADEHVAHSGVTLTAGTGLTGGGDISAGRTFAVDGVLEDLDTLGPNAADSELIVGTAAGALAWESGATLRTSLGLGTGSNVTFASLDLTSGGAANPLEVNSGASGSIGTFFSSHATVNELFFGGSASNNDSLVFGFNQTGDYGYLQVWGDAAGSALAVQDAGIVSVGTAVGASKFNVTTGASIGATYISTAAPTNGMIVEGTAGFGTATPSAATPIDIENSGNGVQTVARFFNTNQTNDAAEAFFGSAQNNNNSLVFGFTTVGAASTSNYGYFQVWGDAAGSALVIADGGKIAVNTIIPATRFQVVGDVRFGDQATNYWQCSSTGDVTFTGSAGFYPRTLNQSAEPGAGTGATQCDTAELVVWTDTDDSKCYLCYNHGGTVKTVELT